ncbi:LysM peptidoglycan-binding domain-containing protein [Rhizobium sp. BK376]|uniref:LysM peptidoglycan-binding domain-containing protein n=1 Tax=Rhizobium sp. BK376 TaxID=2512149 RepID=UPI0010488C8F|nr:LysM peptidoglycan-binding domain-containing protein [Rhizobium sp. BK376]TCR93056.1 LysM domain-containing protein [Rhizobium sp. BK376]
MMKNRAGLLALLVLVIASVIMIFFVMPRLGIDKKPVGDAINQAGDAVKNIIADTQKAGDAAKDTAKAVQNDATNAADATDTATKLGGLTTTAAKSLADLKTLFSAGNSPAAEALATAKTNTVSALQAIVDFALPQGSNAATTALVTQAHSGAGRALGIIKALPDNVADALAAITKAEADLFGKPEPQAQANAGPRKPSFDVLRVEPDGSTVVAGSAEPNSKLQIMDGDKVITTTDVGPSGDFAAVLDNPLPPGDHELVLKAIGKDGNALTSEEVATVSVPKDGSTQLLAMVSKPGTASRIITAPTAKQQRVASDAQPANNGNGNAGSDKADTTMASASPTTNPPPTATAPDNGVTTDTPDVMVNAVEIENDKIFVAGSTRPRAKVRAYADDKLIGEAAAGVDGHFVIDGTMPLAVGDHKIRVDIVDAAGKVLARTAVNFNRPAGNQVTVAAQTPPAVGNQQTADASMVPLDEGELGKLKNDTNKAFGLLKKLYADGKTPGQEELAAARSGTEIALKSLADFRPAIDASVALRDASAMVSSSAAKALAYLHALPGDPKSVGNALARLDQMIAEITKPVADVPAQASVQTASNDPDGTKTYQQAPLSQSNSAVIIRRGDTLWQISRRTYGLGVRYTTIYLANEDKINNPDRILPGQVFGVPKDALPNSEELHRKRMSGQHL